MAKDSNHERRNFFRISDKAAMEIQIASPDQSDFQGFFRLPAQYQLLSEFQLLDIEAHALLHGIYEKDRNIGAYLKVLNRKLDALCRTLALVNDPIDPSLIKDINLSEGGLSFRSDAPYQPDTVLLIKLIMLPSYLGLLVKGKVLTCQPFDDDFEVHLEFSELDDQQRQLIARHILRKQQEERRLRQEF